MRPSIEIKALYFFNPHVFIDCSLSGAEALRVEFDRQCSTERRHDPLTVMDGAGRTVSIRSGNTLVLQIHLSHTSMKRVDLEPT